MIVRMHKEQLRWFKRKCRQYYPKEILACLVGKRVHRGLIDVHYFAYPKLTRSTEHRVDVDSKSMELILETATSEDLLLVGDIHNHANYPPVLSPTDYCGHKADGNYISAILEIPEKGRTRLAIWRDGTPLPCKLKYFNKD
jgi:proteasome lid subunit RPN8/RPN11